MADAHESPGQHVQEEAAQELYGVERHETLLAAMGIVAPAETYLLSVEGQQAMVGDVSTIGGVRRLEGWRTRLIGL